MQDATLHGPGRFSAVALFDPPSSNGHDREALRRCVARLIAAADPSDAGGLYRGALHLLVGVAPRLLEGHPAASHVRRTRVLPRGEGALPSTQRSVLVQVSAATEGERIYGLRLAEGILGEHFHLAEEWCGGSVLGRRETFGYRDGIEAPSRDEIAARARATEDPVEGASWILYQRYTQDVRRFAALDEAGRNAVLGNDRHGARQEPEPRPAAGGRAHVYAMSGLPLVRRGFRYRQGGVEGLVFLGLAAAPAVFEEALDRMLGNGRGDALLHYARAVEGGVYLAPPGADWLARGWSAPRADDPRLAPAELARPVRPSVLYEVTPETLAYMRELIGLGVFDQPYPEIRRLLDAGHHLVAGGQVDFVLSGSPAHQLLDLLDKLRERSLTAATELNDAYGEYVSINV